jgi:hypothetical protein
MCWRDHDLRIRKVSDAAEQLFDDVSALLDLNQGGESASFLHGHWVGLLCPQPLHDDAARQVLLAEPIWKNVSEIEDQQLLQQLVEWTFEGLRDPLLSFQLLLPALDVPLALRAQALVEWMQGFLQGFGESGIREADMNADTRELLQDFLEIAQLDTDLEDNEADEKNLFELVEYCRVAVLSLYEEFAPTASATAVSTSKMLH